MILVIDNYDSFTYNLVQYLGEMGEEIEVFRNDRISPEEAERLGPEKIIISPGPGRPDDAGVSKDIIRHFAGKVPLLGVCLGHQCIGELYGAKVVRSDKIMHGKISEIYHDGEGIFSGVDMPFEATRYHSLVVEARSVNPPLKVTAWTRDKEVMGIEHSGKCVWGVQFHPESILTGEGKKILANFTGMKA